MEVIARFDGRAFPTTPGLARQWVTGRVRRRESSLETVYCAELVATTYQHMGLLPSGGRRAGTTRAVLERRPDRGDAPRNAAGAGRTSLARTAIRAVGVIRRATALRRPATLRLRAWPTARAILRLAACPLAVTVLAGRC